MTHARVAAERSIKSAVVKISLRVANLYMQILVSCDFQISYVIVITSILLSLIINIT